MEPFGKDVLNFSSSNAYTYFLSCGDTHKAWQAFEIFLHGIVLELIHMYASESKEKPINVFGFMEWQRDQKSATLRMVLSLVLTFGLGLYTQKVGDRNNDASISDAGRYTFMNIFYGFNHPYYREIEFRDLRLKALSPVEVCSQLKNNLTFSSCNQFSRAQGGDFLLEQKVKLQKSIAPKGKVDKTTWQRISRCIDVVDDVHENTSKLLNVSDEPYQRNILLSNEILEWRSVLRHSKFLCNKDETHVFNIHGEVLNPELKNLSYILEQKRSQYSRDYLDGINLENIKLDLIRICLEEETEE